MENTRTINRLISVFDLPDMVEWPVQGNENPRVMMIYDRQHDRREFSILSKDLAPETRTRVTRWLEHHGHLCDDHFGVH